MGVYIPWELSDIVYFFYLCSDYYDICPKIINFYNQDVFKIVYYLNITVFVNRITTQIIISRVQYKLMYIETITQYSRSNRFKITGTISSYTFLL